MLFCPGWMSIGPTSKCSCCTPARRGSSATVVVVDTAAVGSAAVVVVDAAVVGPVVATVVAAVVAVASLGAGVVVAGSPGEAPVPEPHAAASPTSTRTANHPHRERTGRAYRSLRSAT